MFLLNENVRGVSLLYAIALVHTERMRTAVYAFVVIALMPVVLIVCLLAS